MKAIASWHLPLVMPLLSMTTALCYTGPKQLFFLEKRLYGWITKGSRIDALRL